MTGIEDLVREALRERVETAPAMDEPAQRAVSGARTVRRRQALVAVCAAALAVVLGAAGLGALRGASHPLPAPVTTDHPSAPASSGLSLLIDHRTLILPNGRPVTLQNGDHAVVSAVQVPQGWLVTEAVTAGSTQSLALVTPDGTVHPLLEGAQPPVVSADGRRFAWRTATRLFIGHLADDGSLVVDPSTPLTGKGDPIALTDNAVVLGATATGGGIDSYDLWLPKNGNYVPSWDVITGVVAVYGPAPGGRFVLGLVHRTAGAKDVCLAELDPANNLRPTRTACGLPLRVDPQGAVSPDGHWLAVASTDGGVAFLDLTRVFQEPTVADRWNADGPGVWLDAGTMVAPVSGRLQRYHVGRGTADLVDVPGLPSGAQVTLVPRRP
jgi:hypothetical protein